MKRKKIFIFLKFSLDHSWMVNINNINVTLLFSIFIFQVRILFLSRIENSYNYLLI